MGATAAIAAAACRAERAERCSTSAPPRYETGHDGDVEPQPLLADERAAEPKALPILGKKGAAQGACGGHSV